MKLDLEVRHLQLVVAVVEEGSVTRAAEHLHLTQSAISHQLREIEGRLGAPLFLRLNKRMILAPAGERLLAVARRMLRELAEVEEEMRQLGAERGGVLRLSTECYTCYHWLPGKLKVFRESFPRVEVRIVAEATRRPLAALFDGRLDLAIVHNAMRDRRLVSRPLFRDELVLITPPDHPLAGRSYINAADLADEHLIVYAAPREELSIFQKLLFPAGVVPRQVSHLELTEAIIEMVKAGLGVGVMARWAIAPQLAAKSLRAVPLTRRGLYRSWAAVRLRTNTPPVYFNAFIDLLAGKEMFT